MTIQRLQKNQKLYHNLMLQIGMTHKPVIDLIHRQYGGHVTKVKPKKGRTFYLWAMTGNAAESLLSSLEPFLIVKRQEALLALEFFRLKQAYKASNGRTITSQELKRRDIYYQQLKDLKRVEYC